MIKYLRIFVLFLLAITCVPAAASAHVLKENNGMSAVLHVPPEDNPIAGEPTELNIAFGDKANAFSLMNCDCQVHIQSDGKTLQTLPAAPALRGATQDSAVNTTFPEGGLYHIIVTGSSRNDSFKNFRLDFLLKVSDDSAHASKPSSEIIIISSGSLIILVMIAYTSISSGGRYKKSNKTARKAKDKS
jgi:hypothetical protein